jgi:hypothetical protein
MFVCFLLYCRVAYNTSDPGLEKSVRTDQLHYHRTERIAVTEVELCFWVDFLHNREVLEEMFIRF